MPTPPSNVENASARNAVAWIDRETLQDLTSKADEDGISLNQHIIEFVHRRALAELIAPSTTWLAAPAAAAPLSIELSEELRNLLGQLCEATGHRLDVVISNLVAGGPPLPSPELRLGFLRTEPGRGRVFGMYFEIAGYQYALLRHLAGEKLPVGRVLDSAFLALARQAATGGFLNGQPVSEVARHFAAKILMIEHRRRA